MNKIMLMGRATAKPEIRFTQGNEHKVGRYTLAVDRRVARNNGENTADFFQIQCWDKKADFAEKYIDKGTKLLVTGRLQSGSYTDKDGKKVYTFDIIAEEQEFCESKRNSEAVPAPVKDDDGFMNIPEGIDEELPFAR